MNENKPHFETQENEKKLKQRIINALKSHNPESQELLLRWMLVQEAKINALNTGRAAIESSVEQGDIYQQAGYLDEAWDVLSDAAEQAFQEREFDLYRLIETKLNDIANLGDQEK